MKQKQQRDSDINDVDPEYLAPEQRLEDMVMAFDREYDDLLERRSYAMNKQHQRKHSIDNINPESPGPVAAVCPTTCSSARAR